jgi:hypothetical protein
MDPNQEAAFLLDGMVQAEHQQRVALQRHDEAVVEVQRQVEIERQLQIQLLGLFEREPAVGPPAVLWPQEIMRPRHPPREIPWKPSINCVQSPDDGGGYGHEERAKKVCDVLCLYIHFHRTNPAGITFKRDVRQLAAHWYITTPPSPREIFLTVDAAIVDLDRWPHLWIIAEAHDYVQGAKYFSCWRNRQVIFPMHEGDGTLRPNLTWKEIFDKLLFQPIHSRCHASPCELGWGPEHLQKVRDLVRNIPEVVKTVY